MSRESHLALDTLPPELRAIIYDILFAKLSILVTWDGKLDTSQYPFQVSAVSQLLRDETLPLLRDYTNTNHLRLLLENGRFPEHIRRRLPSYVLRSIRIITILDRVEHDELKPCLTTFPNLLRLEFDLYKLEELASASSNARFPWLSSRDESNMLMHDLVELHQDQERPGEGLERDYFPENTLWQVCGKPRARRGFDISAQLRIERIFMGSRGDDTKFMTMALDLEDRKLPNVRGLGFN